MTPLAQAAAVILARQSAERLVKKRIRAEGRVPLSTLSYATLTRMANELVEAHPEMIAEALGSPIIAALASLPLPQRGRKAASPAGSRG
jgi:HEPN domain-containing protein